MVLPDAGEKVKEHLDQIERNIHISDKIVGDLLDFTRIKFVDREAVSISDLIRQTLGHFPAPEKVQVKVDVPADLPKAYADPQHVVQVLGNLALNAYQAMPQGGQLLVLSRVEGAVSSRQLSVNTDASTTLSTSHWILITVKDTGSGITPENMKKLFEPLFTTKPKGIGLGLAVCRKLIEANGGRIEVESEVGKGSTFTVWLPIQ